MDNKCKVHDWFDVGPFKICLICADKTEWTIIVPNLSKCHLSNLSKISL